MEEKPTCWLCERELGRKIQQHHTVPKAKKGRATVPVHPICHRAIHANFTNAELARIGEDREALLANKTWKNTRRRYSSNPGLKPWSIRFATKIEGHFPPSDPPGMDL